MRPGKYILLACAVLGFLVLFSTSGAVELTRENYDELTAGKSVLLKLYAPWCTHCKAIKPAWDALMKQYEGHADVLVGESDCTAAGKTLCEDLQVQGYPTLKYGDPTSLTDYQGARDLEGLKRFADSELRPACSLSRIDLCDSAQRGRIEELQALSPPELAEEIAKSEKELAELETKFKRDVGAAARVQGAAGR
jgi:protein disulfide-isomerase-like protein